MKIAVRCNALQREICIQKGFGLADAEFVENPETLAGTTFEAIIDLQYSSNSMYSNLPAGTTLMVHAMTLTSQDLPPGAVRINAWPGCLERKVAELAAAKNASPEKLQVLMEALQWEYQLAPDLPGMFTGRVLATVINEAYFALMEQVSTREEIDTAMKLGTNYPYGPFEWAEKIGHEEIVGVLKAMSQEDERYQPADLLLQEILHLNRKKANI